jgi:hypothetical protein
MYGVILTGDEQVVTQVNCWLLNRQKSIKILKSNDAGHDTLALVLCKWLTQVACLLENQKSMTKCFWILSEWVSCKTFSCLKNRYTRLWIVECLMKNELEGTRKDTVVISLGSVVTRLKCARSQVSPVVYQNSVVFWDVTRCSLLTRTSSPVPLLTTAHSVCQSSPTLGQLRSFWVRTSSHPFSLYKPLL